MQAAVVMPKAPAWLLLAGYSSGFHPFLPQILPGLLLSRERRAGEIRAISFLPVSLFLSQSEASRLQSREKLGFLSRNWDKGEKENATSLQSKSEKRQDLTWRPSFPVMSLCDVQHNRRSLETDPLQQSTFVAASGKKNKISIWHQGSLCKSLFNYSAGWGHLVASHVFVMGNIHSRLFRESCSHWRFSPQR